MTQIKICGLTRIEDIKTVNRWKPDYIGFVFAKSHRQITADQAGILKEKLLPEIKSVGVFVNESMESIVNLCNAGIIDIVQLHGDEKEDYMKELKKLVTCPIIKAVSVQSKEQIVCSEKLSCDYLLLDTYQIGNHGGSGISFDHSLIPALEKPHFLAGGLNLSNITEVIQTNHPYGVDISSGVETDGFKDENKIKTIIEMIRNTDKNTITNE